MKEELDDRTKRELRAAEEAIERAADPLGLTKSERERFKNEMEGLVGMAQRARRERIAQTAMLGLLQRSILGPAEVAHLSVRHADALIAELDKEEKR